MEKIKNEKFIDLTLDVKNLVDKYRETHYDSSNGILFLSIDSIERNILLTISGEADLLTFALVRNMEKNENFKDILFNVMELYLARLINKIQSIEE